MALNWAELWKEVSKIKSGKDTRKNAGDKRKLESEQIDSLRAISHALHERKGVILADEVGLGKTWVALELIRRIIDLGGKVAIVAKESILRKWKEEWIGGWGTRVELKFYEKDMDEKVLLSNSSKIRLYLIPSTLARRKKWKDVQKSIWNIKPDLIVFDEAHNFLTAAKANELIDTLKGKVFLYGQVKALTNKLKENPLTVSQKKELPSLKGKVFTSNQIKDLCANNKKKNKEKDQGKILTNPQWEELKKLLKAEKSKQIGNDELRVLALTATPLGIDIGAIHWENFFNLLGLKEEDKLEKIKSLSKKIIRSAGKETEENKNLIATYREQFEGIIFRSHRNTYYQEFFKKILKGKFGNELLCEAVDKRINRIPIEIDIRESQKNVWRTLVCSVEALSYCPSGGTGTKFDKRSRLTVANTNGLMSIIDNLEKIKNEEEEKEEKEEPISKIEDPAKLAQRIWENVAKECLGNLYEPLNDKEKNKKKGEIENYSEKKQVVRGNPLYKEVVGIVKKHFEDKKESRVLIFSYNTTPASILCDILNEELKKIFKDSKNYCGFIYGDTSLEDRERAIERFSLSEVRKAPNEEQTELKCLIAQIRVAGEGLDLHRRCDTVIFLQPEWSPIYVEQGIGRVDRIKSLWVEKMLKLDGQETNPEEFPKITVYFPKFKETYNFSKWVVLDKRWDLMERILNGIGEPKEDVLHPLHYLQGIRRRS